MKNCFFITLCIFIWLFFSIGIVTDAAAEKFQDDGVSSLARKIENSYRQSVFIVNAYKKICTCNNPQVKEKPGGGKCLRNVGTAFPVDTKGHLITLRSVVNNADKVLVTTSNGTQVNAQILGSDYAGLISVLKIDGHNVSTPPKIKSMESINPGNEVFFLGVIPGMSLAANQGLICAIRPSDGTIEVKTASIPGTSGTPVFDKNENVLGLLAFQIDRNEKNTRIESNEKTYLVISLEYASLLAHQVINLVEARCGWLGLGICIKDCGENGVLIKKVIKGSPADKIGIKCKDRIITFNNITISGPHQFIETFTKTKPGDRVSIKIFREGSLLSFNVTLAERTNTIKK